MAGKTFAVRSSRQKRTGSFIRSGINAAKGSGSFIPPAVKTVFEKGYSSDFSSVRVHHNSQAADLCDKADAKAFTSGNDIFFNKNEYSLSTPNGQHLLAHELAHIKLHSKNVNTIFRQTKATPITGKNTDTYIYKIGSSLNQVILYLLNNSKLVKAYYSGSLALADWPAAKFIIHDFDQDFISAYEKLHHPNKATDDIGGFYFRKTDSMYLKRLSRLGHALHEAVHRLGDDKSDGFLGSFVSEGVTQLITDIILIENKLPRVTDHNYQHNVNCANKLIQISDSDRVLKHYLKFDKSFVLFIFEKIKRRQLNPPTTENLLLSLGC